MKQYEKAEYQAYLDSEKATIADIKKAYESALDQVDEKIRVLSTRKDIENMPSIIHQQKYQEQIKSQLDTILGKLQDGQYKTVNEYLNNCYTEGFLHTMYSMQQQGVPFIMPIDQKAVRRAVVLDSKISGGLYSKIVEDVSAFKASISAEISRGIASSLTYTEIARNLKAASNVPISNASRIVRTEGHRIQSQAKLDSMNEAKDKGADVVKQWDSTLDGKTRETHRELDGQIREIDEDFEIQGMSASAPSLFGDPAEDCNCRCTCLTRARWALSSGFSKMDNFTKELQNFESPDDYGAFKKDYWSKENLEYMNYVTDMEEKYGTKNFEQVLDSMSDKEYAKYQELMKADPVIKIESENEKITKSIDYAVDSKVIGSRAYSDKFNSITSDPEEKREMMKEVKQMLSHRSGTNGEDLLLYNTKTGKWYRSTTGKDAGTPEYTAEILKGIKESNKGELISFHNHPASMPPSADDINSAIKNGYAKGYAMCHDGKIYEYSAGDHYIDESIYNLRIADFQEKGYNEFEAQLETMKYLSGIYGFEFKEV